MNIRWSRIGRIAGFAAVVSLFGTAFGYDYKVRRPSDELRPHWSGAVAGKWTLDFEAAAAAAKSTGKVHLMMVTGSWWCPYCQRFEENVLRSDAWKNYVAEKGYYLSVLDYPYRFHVDDDQLWKSKYPEKGDGWGFQCWLYDDDYLAENGISAEDGLKTIRKFYETQDVLALDTAESNIIAWDNGGTFNLHKVAYPTLIVFLPDGTEAGRFNAQSIYSLPAEEAQVHVMERIDSIVKSALDEQCGLCSDPDDDECGLSGANSQKYRGWLSGDDGIAGLIEVSTGKANKKGVIKVVANVTIRGKRIKLNASVKNGCGSVEVKGKDAKATLKLGLMGLSGVYSDGSAEYAVIGARDAFSAKKNEPELQSRANGAKTGVWSLAMRSEESDYPMAGGYGALVVELKRQGKARISGLLGDKTKVSYSGQLIAGDDGVYCLPVVVAAYPGKKGGFGCCMWFKNGWLFNVTDITKWTCTGKDPFSVTWSPVYSAQPGTGDISDDMELLFANPPTEINKVPLEKDPNADSITSEGSKWVGTDESGFSARISHKTCQFSGYMYFHAAKNGKRISKIRAPVFGVVSGGIGYGTVYVKSVGTWAVKISACAACED